MDLPRGVCLLSEKISDISQWYVKLPENFQGSVRIVLKSDSGSTVFDFLIEKGKLMAATFEDAGNDTLLGGLDALEKIQDMPEDLECSLEVCSLSDLKIALARKANSQFLLKEPYLINASSSDAPGESSDPTDQKQAYEGASQAGLAEPVADNPIYSDTEFTRLCTKWDELEHKWDKLDSIDIVSAKELDVGSDFMEFELGEDSEPSKTQGGESELHKPSAEESKMPETSPSKAKEDQDLPSKPTERSASGQKSAESQVKLQPKKPSEPNAGDKKPSDARAQSKAKDDAKNDLRSEKPADSGADNYFDKKPNLVKKIGFTDRLRLLRLANASNAVSYMDGKKTVSDIATTFKIEKAELKKLIDELEKRGYVRMGGK